MDTSDSVHAARVVALLAVVAIGAMWLQHQLGFEFERLGWVGAAGIAWGILGKLASFLGEDSRVASLFDRVFKAPIRAVVQYLAQPMPLYVLSGGLAIAMATISSVTVRSGLAGETTTVTLVSLDPPGAPDTITLISGQPSVRFLPVFTSPFGRLYQLDAEGYVAAPLQIFPLVGRQVSLGRDLVASPSVLFRPFVEGISALADGAVFSVDRWRGGKPERLVVHADSGAEATAFLLGRPKPITDAATMFWDLEATANSTPEAVKASLLVRWRSPKQLRMDGELAPDDCLVAEIRLHDQLKSRAVIAIGGASFVDVLLRDASVEPAKRAPC